MSDPVVPLPSESEVNKVVDAGVNAAVTAGEAEVAKVAPIVAKTIEERVTAIEKWIEQFSNNHIVKRIIAAAENFGKGLF